MCSHHFVEPKFWWCKLMHIVIIFHIYRIFINMFQTLLVSFCFQRGLPLSWPTGCVLPSPLCSNSTEIGRCGKFDAQQSASWFQYLNLEHVKWRMWADGDDIYIYIHRFSSYILYIHTCMTVYMFRTLYICIYDYEICQISPIVNYVEVVHVCFFKPRSPWARGFNLWFIGKRTIWLVTFPMSTYIFRFSWLSRAIRRPTGRFDSNLMSTWPAEIQKHAPAHLLRFYMWSPLIFLGPVILLWRRCAFNTVSGEIPASVARLSGEVFSKRAPNLKHRTTWITWTTYKFLETHHKLRFFRQLLGLTYWNLDPLAVMDLSKRLEKSWGIEKKWEWGESWWKVQRTRPRCFLFGKHFFGWMQLKKSLPKAYISFPESNLPSNYMKLWVCEIHTHICVESTADQ